MLHVTMPHIIPDILNSATGSTPEMMQATYTGRVFGKASSWPCPSQTRAILPQTSVQTIIDIVVASALIEHLNRIYLATPSTLVAGMFATQTMDVDFS